MTTIRDAGDSSATMPQVTLGREDEIGRSP